MIVLIIPPPPPVAKKDEIEARNSKIEDLQKRMNKDDSDGEMKMMSLETRKRRAIKLISFYFIIFFITSFYSILLPTFFS